MKRTLDFDIVCDILTKEAESHQKRAERLRSEVENRNQPLELHIMLEESLARRALEIKDHLSYYANPRF